MGDIGLSVTIEDMARTNPPALTIELGEKPFPRVASITDAGQHVSAGAVDYLSLNPPERWVGGVHIPARLPVWRFDAANRRVAYTT